MDPNETLRRRVDELERGLADLEHRDVTVDVILKVKVRGSAFQCTGYAWSTDELSAHELANEVLTRTAEHYHGASDQPKGSA